MVKEFSICFCIIDILAGKQVGDEDLEEMIESGNPGVFTQGIITDTQQAKQTLADIEARHNDIMKLESSIRELHDMFMDMAMLVESQVKFLNNRIFLIGFNFIFNAAL